LILVGIAVPHANVFRPTRLHEVTGFTCTFSKASSTI
jgi:hypothetical protein